MRIATWNVNSIRSRLDRVLAVCTRWDLDVLLMQETKCKPDQFPTDAFAEQGYQVAVAGLNQWNGVAIASRVGLEDVHTSFDQQPGFAKEGQPVVEPRAIGALVGARGTSPGTQRTVIGGTPSIDASTAEEPREPLHVWSLYVPNGRAIGDPHLEYKKQFLHTLADDVSHWMADNPHQNLLLAGDFNVAQRDEDVWDIDAFAGNIYVTREERDALNALKDAGLTEVSRTATESPYTFWEYRQLRFPRNEGMRIDYMWVSPSLADLVTAAHIDREERKGKGASDHVPVILDIDV
ncbi:MAG: exodeoxyribonuclease III [Actinomycetaceae bacterium]|nr:exodeoxyribonuclease III [Actinomycetaceae bacterium]MDY6083496.1 exodeoxyribonuclease III [Actinomycetaceae bacterium]